MPDNAPAAQVRACPRQLPRVRLVTLRRDHTEQLRGAAFRSRSRTCGGRFRPPLRLFASALEPRLEADRPIHCPCRPGPFYMPLLGAVAATFKGDAPALRDNPYSIAASTAQRQVLARARSSAASSGRWRRPYAAKSRAHPSPTISRIYSSILAVSTPDFGLQPMLQLLHHRQRAASTVVAQDQHFRACARPALLRPPQPAVEDLDVSPAHPLMAMEIRVNR